MTTLIGIHSLSKSYGALPLFSDLSLTITRKSRIGLIGPNGAGKSTLLKIINGMEEPDNGSITRRTSLKIGYTSQFPEFPSMPLEEFLIAPFSDKLEARTQARILLSKAQFSDTTVDAATLSGGWKKRFDIVRALMDNPDLLLLDEPTNHLDIEGILWLEKLLTRESFDFMVISHDRYFLENVCTSIIELNRVYPNNLLQFEGSLSRFMEHKEAFLEAQKVRERVLSQKEEEEIAWMKRSPKARTTKSRSRIESTYALIDEVKELKSRNKEASCSIDFTATERQTRKLLATKNLSKALGPKQLFKGIDLVLSPGTRLGIVGENGTGKTTLLKILAGKMAQDNGTLKYADGIQMVYFDQLREELPPNITIKEALSPSGEFVTFRGRPIHVHGYAKRFLFPKERLTLPVNRLSGGEKARILLARLMLTEADILFLDEPTNDLDITTLEIFEESMAGFPGAVVLISHDRCLMDRVCTSIIGLGRNNEHELFASFDQWEEASLLPKAKEKKEPLKEKPVERPQQKKKLSYKEQKELDTMEEKILAIEEECASLEKKLTEVEGESMYTLYKELGEKESLKTSLYARWQDLLNKEATLIL